MPQAKGRHAADSIPLGRGREPYAIYHDPVPVAHPGRRAKYPFAQMQVGNCFYVPLAELKSHTRLLTAARQWAKRNSRDWKFVTRAVGDRIGIWRVS